MASSVSCVGLRATPHPPHLTRVGSRLTPFESSLAFTLPLAFLNAGVLRPWFIWNLKCQAAVFMPVALLPALMTNHIGYIDLGWPIGLVILGMNGFIEGNGFYWRRLLMGGVLCMHGAWRLFCVLMRSFPHRWEADRERYRYVQLRFEKDGLPER